MNDNYPNGTSIPGSKLVHPDLQPNYFHFSLPMDGGCNVGDRLSDAHVREGRGDLIAAVHAETDRHYTFSELARESTCLAAGLIEFGIHPGDRVAYRTTNDPDALIVMLAIWKAGGVVVPVPAQAKVGEIRNFITDTGARLFFIHGHAGPLDDIKAGIRGTNVEAVVGFGDGHKGWDVCSWETLKRGGQAASRGDSRPTRDHLAYRRNDRHSKRLLPHAQAVPDGRVCVWGGDRSNRRAAMDGGGSNWACSWHHSLHDLLHAAWSDGRIG